MGKPLGGSGGREVRGELDKSLYCGFAGRNGGGRVSRFRMGGSKVLGGSDAGAV